VSELAYQSFLKSGEELKYFFVVVLWDKLFKVKNYEFATERALNYIQKASQYGPLFANWLEDIPTEHMRAAIKCLHGLLEFHCRKLVEK
jgi:hypothetical protein